MKTAIVSTSDTLTLSDLALNSDEYFIFAYSKNKLYGFILYDEDIEEWICLESSNNTIENLSAESLQDLYNDIKNSLHSEVEIRYEKIYHNEEV